MRSQNGTPSLRAPGSHSGDMPLRVAVNDLHSDSDSLESLIEVTMGPASENKRRWLRRHCELPVEIRAQGAAYPIKCETTDVSPYGCYVTLMSTLPKGTVLNIVLWAGDTAL